MNERLISLFPELWPRDRRGPAVILVVEDDPASQALLVGLLSDEGYRVLPAGGAWEALQVLEREPPDLVVSDVCMSGGDGLSLVEALREGPHGRLPVILVSAQVETDRRVRALDLGADDFVTKPIDLDELLARVRAQLRRSQRERELASRSYVDELTGLPNRRALMEFFAREQRAARRTGQAQSLAMVDVNAFKSLNDTHGHAAGDEALRSVARFLFDTVRATDCVGRLGGDEFLIVLRDAGESEAEEFASRLRARLPLTFELTPELSLPLWLAVGVTTARPLESLELALPRADARMYDDKRRSSLPPRGRPSHGG